MYGTEKGLSKDELMITINFRRQRSAILRYIRDFPGGPVVKTLPSNAEGVGSIPGRGSKIPHASWPKNQSIKQKQYCNKFNKDFKICPLKKNLKKKKIRYIRSTNPL